MGDPRPGRRDGSAGRLGGTGEAHAAEHEPPGSTSVEDRPGKAPNGDGGTRGGTGFRAVAQSVGAAMIGVQSRRNRERDFTEGKPLHFVVGGLLGTLAFVLGVWLLVRYLIATG